MKFSQNLSSMISGTPGNVNKIFTLLGFHAV